MSETNQPNNARQFLELLHAEILSIKAHLDKLDPPAADDSPEQEDQLLTLLESILTTQRDQQTSHEVLHQRIDAIARYVPGAARAVSGKR
jgi:hypothetical protein